MVLSSAEPARGTARVARRPVSWHVALTGGSNCRISLLSHPAFGSGPMAGQVSAVQAAVVEEKGIMVEEARFDRSPYYKNKKPWDN